MAVLTLTSDFGIQDYLAGAVKGLLLQIDPSFNLVDISHAIRPFNYPQAAYVCRNAIRHFPELSYHLILVSLFERKNTHLLLAYHKNQYYLCADNGLLPMILEEKPELVIGLPMDPSLQGHTLHCIETFGKAIAALNQGERITDIGEPDFPYLEKNPLKPWLQENSIEGQIIYIDQFENVVVNITREQFDAQRKGRGFVIIFKRNETIERLSNHYAEVPEGEKLAHFNAAGYLEISVNKGNAAGLFGLQGYAEQSQNAYLQNRLFYQTVKIFFQ
jgi:S-adenosylmethionine hydrolase